MTWPTCTELHAKIVQTTCMTCNSIEIDRMFQLEANIVYTMMVTRRAYVCFDMSAAAWHRKSDTPDVIHTFLSRYVA